MEGLDKPIMVDTFNILGQLYYDINIDVEPMDGGYKWEQVQLTKEKWNYGGIVDALIQHKYPVDKMQAVINNYLLDPNDEAVIQEFNEMQEWRKQAKEIAKQALEYKI